MSESNNITKLHEIGQTIATIRQRPLLLMFYSRDDGDISTRDLYYLEKILEKKIKDTDGDLDVIIQTMGGSAEASYLLSQLIRNFCRRMEIFVPYYAYSGGTLITLSSNLIHLGRTARLSPIDLQLSYEGNVSLFPILSIDKYIEFIENSCEKLKFPDYMDDCKARYISSMMHKLLRERSPTELGTLFRLKDLTNYYAQILLKKYMLQNEEDRDKKALKIIYKLTNGSPDHDFEIDLHIARGIGLNVCPIEERLYKPSRLLIDICQLLLDDGKICKHYSSQDDERRPFFEVFLPQKNEKDGTTNNDE